MPRTSNRKGTVIALCGIAVILLTLMVFSAGCINSITSAMQERTGTEQDSLEFVPQATSVATGPGMSDITPAPARQPPSVEVTPLKSDSVTEVAPILTPDPYPVLHGTRINETRRYSFLYRTPEFVKTYVLRGNATGLLVNVVEGPLYIVYEVIPQHDCILEPESCRGSMESPVSRPYMKITVRDNQTQEIVAEDGYAREYSSDTGNYEFIITSKNMAGSTSSGGELGSNTVSPGPRYIPVYKEGVFHITIEGNYLSADLSIITGASPDPLEVNMEPKSGSSAPTAPPPPEEEDWG